MSTEHPTSAAPAPDAAPVTLVPVRRSRGVRFLPWLATGGALGVLAGILVGAFGPQDARYTGQSQTGYLALIGLLLGLMVFGTIAAVVDMVLTRRR